MAELFDFTTQPQSSNERWPENTLRISGINNSGRDLESIIARDNIDNRGGLTLTGGPATYSIAAARSLAGVTLFTGLGISAFVNITNSNSPTLNVSGTGSRNIRLSTGVPARASDMIIGMVAKFVFNAADDSWILTNPANIHPAGGKVELEGDQPFFEGSSTRNTAFTSMVLVRGIGRNSAAEDIEYNRLDLQAADVADGSEDGRFVIRQMSAGTLTAGFDLRDANRLALFNEPPDGADNSLAVPSDFSLVRNGVKQAFGELVRVTKVDNGTHVFQSETEYCVIEAAGAGGGGNGSPASYGNVPSVGGDGSSTTVIGTNISITARGGRGASSERNGEVVTAIGPSTSTGSSINSSYSETGAGAQGGRGAYAGSDGNDGDRAVAFCESLPASVTVTQGTGGTGGVTQGTGQGAGSDGLSGFAIIWEYR